MSRRPSPSAAAGDRRIIPIATALMDAWSSPKNGRREIRNRRRKPFQSFKPFEPFERSEAVELIEAT